jgi:hypothetical protein
MKPADDPKVLVLKDGDRWTAIIGDERFERFRSEADAWGFVRCLCNDDAGEWDKVDLSFAMAEYRRFRAWAKVQLEAAAGDPDRFARAQRTIALNEEFHRQRLMHAADAEGRSKTKH